MSRNNNSSDRPKVSRLSGAPKQGSKNSAISGSQAARMLNKKREAVVNRKEKNNDKDSEMSDEKQMEFQEVELDPNSLINELRKSKCYVRTESPEDDSITIFLPHNGFYPKENKFLKNQQYMNKLLNSLRIAKHEFNYPKLGIKDENQLVKAIARSTTIFDTLLRKTSDKNYELCQFSIWKIRIYLKLMHLIDDKWDEILLSQLKQCDGYIVHELESININRKIKPEKNHTILLQKIPNSYVYNGVLEIKPVNEINNNLKKVLIEEIDEWNDKLLNVEFMKVILPNNVRKRSLVQHNAKLIFVKGYDPSKWYGETIRIGFNQSNLIEWKSKMEMRLLTEPFIVVMSQTCYTCKGIGHMGRWCPRAKEEKEQYEKRLIQSGIQRGSEDFKGLVERFKPKNSCNRCGQNTHETRECKSRAKYCTNCHVQGHSATDIYECTKMYNFSLMVNGLFTKLYGNNWALNDDIKNQIKQDYPRGVSDRDLKTKLLSQEELIKIKKHKREETFRKRMVENMSGKNADVGSMIDKCNKSEADGIEEKIEQNRGFINKMVDHLDSGMQMEQNVNFDEILGLDKSSLNEIKKNLKTTKNFFEQSSKAEKTRKTNASKRLFAMNDSRVDGGNIPNMDDFSGWKLSGLQKFVVKNEIKQKGSKNFNVSEMAQMGKDTSVVTQNKNVGRGSNNGNNQ